MTRFIYKPGKGRLESGKQGRQSRSLVYFFLFVCFFFLLETCLCGEMILSKAGVESVSRCSSASPVGELMETTQVGSITKC